MGRTVAIVSGAGLAVLLTAVILAQTSSAAPAHLDAGDCPSGSISSGSPDYFGPGQGTPAEILSRVAAGNSEELRALGAGKQEIVFTDATTRITRFKDASGRAVASIEVSDHGKDGWQVDLIQTCAPR